MNRKEEIKMKKEYCFKTLSGYGYPKKLKKFGWKETEENYILLLNEKDIIKLRNVLCPKHPERMEVKNNVIYYNDDIKQND